MALRKSCLKWTPDTGETNKEKQIFDRSTRSDKGTRGDSDGSTSFNDLSLGWGTSISAEPELKNLNWDGQTGGFVTPFAYTAPSGKGLGRPVVAFHYLATGPVIGGYHQASTTVGLMKRMEFGYTHSWHQAGSTAGLSQLWSGGFNTMHGKVNMVAENLGHKWVPAVSAGFVVRSQVRNVGGMIGNRDSHNGDIYLVATKTVTQVKGLPMLFSGGIRGTNASVYGLAGNAPAFQGRWFGTAAFVVSGPRSTLIFGSEVAQQPRRVAGLPDAAVPSTLTYFVRVVPKIEGTKMNIDFGVAQVAGNVMPGVNLRSRHQSAIGVSYQF